MSAPDLVVFVGLDASVELLASALPLLDNELAARGIRVGDAAAPPGVGGAPVLVMPDGPPAVVADPSDASAFCSLSATDVAGIVSKSGARRTRIVFCPERQDRLLERSWRRAVAEGYPERLALLYPRHFEPLLDFRHVVDELRAVPGVTDVRVLPTELLGAGPLAFVGALLEALEPARPFELGALARWRPPREFSPRGARIAVAMAPHLDIDTERAQVRGYVLENFSVPAGTSPVVLTAARRSRLLAAYAAANRAFFTECAPQFPADSYNGRAGLVALAATLAPVELPRLRQPAAVRVRRRVRRALGGRVFGGQGGS